jgi:hypothetical protein
MTNKTIMPLQPHEAVILLACILTGCAIVVVALLTGCASVPEHKLSGYAKFRGDKCEVCGATENLEWAHAHPQKLCKGTELEYLINERTNGVTLCRGKSGNRGCHDIISHYGNTGKYWNSNLLPIIEALKAARREYK